VILCEGGGDKNFFQQLIGARGLPDFYVTHPRQEIDPGGRGGFTSRLRSLRLQPGFEQVTGIIVVSDNDADPNGSFGVVRSLIHDAEFKTPNHPARFIAGRPAVAVLMVPAENENGQLETLCLQAIRDAWPIQFGCADTYAACAGIADWTVSKQEKAKVRALISHICRQDPNTSLSYLWHGNREEVIPLSHHCFNRLADFLDGFDAAVAAL
jgi:hypothetical protein